MFIEGFMANSFIKSIAISNNFDIKKGVLEGRAGVNNEKNKIISGLVDPFHLSYIDSARKVVKCLKDKSLWRYQQNLINKRLDEVDVNTIDVDKIEILLKLTEKDLQRLLHTERGLGKVGVQAKQKRLSVSVKNNAGTKNRGFSKRHNKAYFTRTYSIFIDGDDYRSVEIYVGDAEHPNNVARANIMYNVEINFVPTRFTLEQISLIFWHLKSKLLNKRYNDLFKYAKVKRFDIGYMLYGVSQLFGFVTTAENSFVYGTSYPEDEESIQESSYIGLLQNNNRIAYEKVLKEFKFFINYHSESFKGHDFSDLAPDIKGLSDWYKSRICTLRVEARHKSGSKHFNLSGLPDVSSGLADIRIIKPEYIQTLSDKRLKELILDKSLPNKRQVVTHLIKKLQLLEDELYFKFDEEKLENAQRERLERLVNVITNPEKTHDAPPIPVNYSKSAESCAQILTKIAETRVVENPNNIRFSSKKIVYVEGCAGAGKTKLIAGQISKLGSARFREIGAMTFTNNSTNDIRERLDDEFPNNNINVDTISSWCSQSLRKKNLIKGDVIKRDEACEILQAIIDEANTEFSKEKALTGEDVFSVISHARAFSNPTIEQSIRKINDNLIPHKDLIEEVYAQYKSYKSSIKREDFDGLIELLDAQLEDTASAKQFIGDLKYLFVDEVQDLNSRQWSLLNKLHKSGVKIMVVGDPAQAMYQFRGAVPQKLNNKSLKIYKLRINYRSTQKISDLTNKFRKKINNRFLNTISDVGEGEKPRLVTFDNITNALKWVFNDIKHKDLRHEEVFILCRFHKHLDAVNNLLKAEFKKDHSIKSMTFHASKGLQAEYVYVIDPRFRWMGFTDANEELCNMYVALSRAKRWLTIVRSTAATVDNKDDKNYRKRNLLDEINSKLCEII